MYEVSDDSFSTASSWPATGNKEEAGKQILSFITWISLAVSFLSTQSGAVAGTKSKVVGTSNKLVG